jgi:ribonuclease-3 family protein
MSGDELFATITFKPSGRPPKLMNALTLAYIGDAVFEVYVRQNLLAATNHKPHYLHKQSIKYVSANAQSAFLEILFPILTNEETDVVKRGRNAHSGTVPKNVDLLVYRRATGFESLIGFLYLEQRFTRLNELMQLVFASRE